LPFLATTSEKLLFVQTRLGIEEGNRRGALILAVCNTSAMMTFLCNTSRCRLIDGLTSVRLQVEQNQLVSNIA
jgi:hypothetical protein